MTTVLDPLDVNHIQRGVGKYVKHEQFNTTNFVYFFISIYMAR